MGPSEGTTVLGGQQGRGAHLLHLCSLQPYLGQKERLPLASSFSPAGISPRSLEVSTRSNLCLLSRSKSVWQKLPVNCWEQAEVLVLYPRGRSLLLLHGLQGWDAPCVQASAFRGSVTHSGPRPPRFKPLSTAPQLGQRIPHEG